MIGQALKDEAELKPHFPTDEIARIAKMGKVYQVFVSSPYADLHDERKHVSETLAKAGYISAGMELFPATSQEQLEFIKRVIDRSDYYVVIVAGTYGSLADDGVSFTEKEYEYAVSKNIPILAFLHKNPEAMASGKTERDQKLIKKLDAFRTKLKANCVVDFWSDYNDLCTKVVIAVGQSVNLAPGIGWVRGDQPIDPKLLPDFEQLRRENEELRQRLSERSATRVTFPNELLSPNEPVNLDFRRRSFGFTEFAHGPKLDRTLRYFCIGLLPALAIIHVVTKIGLFGDGSWFLVNILARRDFFMPDATRNYATIITQLPLIISLRAGLQNIDALLLLHSFGLVLTPTLLWTSALVVLQADLFFWPFVLLVAVVNLNTSFFAVGETTVAYSICACSMAILLRNKRLGFSASACLLALAFFVTRTYEALVFMGPLLAAMTALRMHASRGRTIVLATLLVACILFVASAVIAASSIFHAADYPYLSAALKTTATIIWRDRQLLLSLLIPLIYLIFLFRAWHEKACILCVPGFAAILLLLAWPGNWAEPVQYYDRRIITGLVLFAFGMIALLIRSGCEPDIKWPSRFSALTSFANVSRSFVHRKFWFCIPTALVMELTVVDIYHSLEFRSFTGMLRNEVDSRRGLVALETTSILERSTSKYGWSWAYPSMSLVLRSDASKAVVLNSRDYRGWQPFDPHTSIPDLHLYYR
jgi:hypothetical protein